MVGVLVVLVVSAVLVVSTVLVLVVSAVLIAVVVVVVVEYVNDAQEQAELMRDGEFWHWVAYAGRSVVAVWRLVV